MVLVSVLNKAKPYIITDSSWVLTATPIATSSQAGDGIICLNDQGQKFWTKGATDCALSATSNWLQ